MKNMVSFVLLILMGFVFGRFSANISPLPEPGNSNPQFKCVNSKNNQNLSLNKTICKSNKNDIEKAFKLFLFSLGLQISVDQEKTLKSLVNNPAAFNSSLLAKDKNKNRYVKLDKGFELEKDFPQLKEYNKKLDGIYLNKPLIYKLNSKSKKDYDFLKNISGKRYEAELIFISGKRIGKKYTIILNIDFNFNDEKKQIDGGTYSIRIENEIGKHHSSRSGTDGDNPFFTGEDNRLLIKMSTKSFFHFKGSEINVAHYYEDGKLAGVANFYKVTN